MKEKCHVSNWKDCKEQTPDLRTSESETITTGIQPQKTQSALKFSKTATVCWLQDGVRPS